MPLLQASRCLSWRPASSRTPGDWPLTPSAPGITLFELATGQFPYPRWNSVFEQLTQVVSGDPPRLASCDNGNTFTAEFVDFVNTWSVTGETEYGF